MDRFKELERIVGQEPMSEADSKAARLGRGKSLRKPFTWPGGQLGLVLVVLTSLERDDSRAAAFERVKQRKLDPTKLDATTIELVATESVCQMLARAVLDPTTGEPYFSSAEEMRAIATDDEIDALFNLYSDHKRSVDPDIRTISDEEFREIDEAIKKKDVTRLSDIASGLPRRSLLSMVDQLANSLTASSGTTSDESTLSQPEEDSQPAADQDDDEEPEEP